MCTLYMLKSYYVTLQHRTDFLQLAMNAQHEIVDYEERDGNKETQDFSHYKERGIYLFINCIKLNNIIVRNVKFKVKDTFADR